MSILYIPRKKEKQGNSFKWMNNVSSNSERELSKGRVRSTQFQKPEKYRLIRK